MALVFLGGREALHQNALLPQTFPRRLQRTSLRIERPCPAPVVAITTGMALGGISAARRRCSWPRSRPLTPCMAARESLAEAVAEGRMITLEESNLRKAGGAFFLVLFIWQASLVMSTGAATLSIAGSSYITLALLASNAAGFGGSGFLNL